MADLYEYNLPLLVEDFKRLGGNMLFAERYVSDEEPADIETPAGVLRPNLAKLQAYVDALRNGTFLSDVSAAATRASAAATRASGAADRAEAIAAILGSNGDLTTRLQLPTSPSPDQVVNLKDVGFVRWDNTAKQWLYAEDGSLYVDWSVFVDASAAYRFDGAPSDPFFDLSGNGRDIDQQQWKPSRIPEGVYLSGAYVQLPAIEYQTIALTFYMPESDSGWLFSSRKLVPGTGNINIGIEVGKFLGETDKIVVDACSIREQQSNRLKGRWMTLVVTLNESTAADDTKIGMHPNESDASQFALTDTKLAAVIAFERKLTRSECNNVCDVMAEWVRHRPAVTVNRFNLPRILFGMTAINAPTYNRTLNSPYEPEPYPRYYAFVHPSVLDMEERLGYVGAEWNGYRYWMAITPYPESAVQTENPCIYASSDGDTWERLSNVSYPLVEPSETIDYLSDTNIALDPDGVTMHLLYRAYDGANGIIMHTQSTDGWETFTEPQPIVSDSSEKTLAPSMVYDETISQWRMWTVDAVRKRVNGSRNLLVERHANHPSGPWSDPIHCKMPGHYSISATSINSDLAGPWHATVIRDPRVGGFFCFACCNETGSSQGQTVAYALTSNDGFSWFKPDAPLLERGRPTPAWDQDMIYVGSPVITSTGYDIWYTGYGAEEEVSSSTEFEYRLGRTAANLS